MSLQLIKDYPPNFSDILKVFPVANKYGVIFTFGDKIFSPTLKDIPEQLLLHEAVHSNRQGSEPEKWWELYLKDSKFRYQEELLAHRVEYNYFTKEPRNIRRLRLKEIARRLSSPLYGKMVNFDTAKLAIKKQDVESSPA